MKEGKKNRVVLIIIKQRVKKEVERKTQQDLCLEGATEFIYRLVFVEKDQTPKDYMLKKKVHISNRHRQTYNLNKVQKFNSKFIKRKIFIFVT